MTATGMPEVSLDGRNLRAEIATAAARLIAEDGADYPTAQRKAARQILGDTPPPANCLPDHAQIEAEVRIYQSLFHGNTHPARLFRLRTLAVDLMEKLADFQPYLTGAVLQGTAGPHDDIHLQLFADSAKEVEIFLLNKNVQIDLSETPHYKGPRFGMVETVSFLWHQEGVHAQLYELDDQRGAVKSRANGKLLRADLDSVRALLISTPHEPSDDSLS